MKKQSQNIQQLHGSNPFTKLMTKLQEDRIISIEGHYYDEAAQRGLFLSTINKEVAENLLNLNTPDNRIMPRNNVEFLSNEMNDQNWEFNGDTIRFTVDGELADAQTRLKAFTKSNLEKIRLLFVYDLPKSAMATIDRGKHRNPVDFFAMNGVKVNTAAVVRVTKVIYWASRNKLYQLNNRKEGDKNLKKCFDAHSEAIISLAAKAVSIYKDYSHFSQQPILTQAEFVRFYGLFAACSDDAKATRYITSLTFGVNLDIQSPATTIRNMILAEGGRSNRYERRKLSNKVFSTYVIRGWFAFISNTTLSAEQANSMQTLPPLVPFARG